MATILQIIIIQNVLNATAGISPWETGPYFSEKSREIPQPQFLAFNPIPHQLHPSLTGNKQQT